ncbi:MAG TPA: transporter substrate-binding domain-containing protein [Flexivirga sp.]|uniref:transporter substrate-binding domain-containing protein n=1 Tax=Flexivirga sp. TaxID=1962927 RepID=UPI002BEC525D|nr:transporter substrate-binding domain-containing protein [Flexivirga sp.]HWC22316.1 transporter substrate-binding domain-containing protein [Flexivirga sp.]
MKRTNVNRSAWAAAAGILAVSLAACGSSGGASTASISSAAAHGANGDPAARSLLPATIRKSGVITIGSSFSGAGLYYLNKDNKPDGTLVKLLEADAAHLGLTLHWTKISFSGLIPAMASGKIDMVGSQTTKTAENAKQANFLGLYETSASVVARKGKAYSSTDDLCGSKLAFSTGATIAEDVAKSIDQQCRRDGKASVTTASYGSSSDGALAVRTGRIDGYIIATPNAISMAKAQPGLTVALKDDYANRVTGNSFAQTKDGLALAKAFQTQMNAMINSGEYAKIIKATGSLVTPIDRSLINAQIKAAS